MAVDEIANPEGQFRRVAGGSSSGTSTGAAIVGTEDPLAGLNAATPGLDNDPDGGLSWTSTEPSFEGPLPGPNDGGDDDGGIVVLPSRGDSNGLMTALLALVGTALAFALVSE